MRKEKLIIIINFIRNKNKFYFTEKMFINVYLKNAVIIRTIIIVINKIIAINKDKFFN